MFRRLTAQAGRWLLAILVALTAPATAQDIGGKPDDFLADGSAIYLLENVRIVDGTGAAAREGLTVLIDGGKIARIGTRPETLPQGTKRINLTGHTVLPGLIMMHEHINYFSGAYVWDSQPGSVPKLLLAAGVTTARTAGGEAPQVDLNLKKRIDDGRAPGPRLMVTGAYLNGPEGGFLGDTVVHTAAEARAATAYWASQGATSMKVYSTISPDALRGAVEEANRRGLHVAGHLGEISCTDAANDGIHTIEHSLTSCAKDLGIGHEAMASFRYDRSAPEARRLITLLVEKKIVIVSTPAMTEPYQASDEELSMLSPDQRERYADFVRTAPAWWHVRPVMAGWDQAHRAFERDFVASGGRLLVGGDASDFGIVPGYGNHRAMIALVRGGFTPLQVIKFATSDAAAFLKIQDRGTIAEGMAADLLIVAGAPDRQIEDIRNVRYVFKDGRAYDPVKLRAASKGQLGRH